MSELYDFEVKNIDGSKSKLAEYQGDALLIVNTASGCGFTPQYKGLEELYQKHKAKNFKVLAFPCNQFGEQEPADESEIAKFCELNFQVTFPLFSKVEVKGAGAHPLYEYLTDSLPGFLGSKAVKWNFTKFLINKEGKVIKRYAPQVKPANIEDDILAIL